ncbi:hypothetical protein KW785_03215 [Candidatus Parcubacteria bacterium]|nr:hypothetical protein [Candidatus Parcubacteria bacterium]
MEGDELDPLAAPEEPEDDEAELTGPKKLTGGEESLDDLAEVELAEDEEEDEEIDADLDEEESY